MMLSITDDVAGTSVDDTSVVDVPIVNIYQSSKYSVSSNKTNNAVIRGMTDEEKVKSGLSKGLPFTPVVNIANNAKIAMTGSDLTGYVSFDDEIQDARVYFVVDVLSLGLTGLMSAPFEGAGNATGSYRQLINAGEKDAHHIIQDAAMRDIKRYDRFKAPAIQLDGPSTLKGTPHNIATSIQRQAGGGTYGAERRIGYKALRMAGISVEDAKSAIRGADRYFMDELGLRLDSVTRIPGNR